VNTKSTMAFIHEFAKAPAVVASVIPSGQSLTRQITASIPRRRDMTVVELGAGTGAGGRGTGRQRNDQRGSTFHAAAPFPPGGPGRAQGLAGRTVTAR